MLERVGLSHFIRSTFPATTLLADRELLDELRRQGIGAAATGQTPRREELFPQTGEAVTRELIGRGCGGSASRSRRKASRAPSPELES